MNSFTSNYQFYADVAIDTTGAFVVVWHSYSSPGLDDSFCSVNGQFFAADGNFVGDELQINTFTTGPQNTPAVGGNAGGRFVVVWDDRGLNSAYRDGSFYGIFGQRFRDLIFTDGFESGDSTAWSDSVP